MVWKLRADGDGPPDYGSNSDHFTIRMHHSGKLLNLGSICYLSGSVNYFDFCSEDEISMLEIVAMSKELGLIDIFGFYHSRGRLNDYSELVLMDDDHDAMNLVNFIDEERVTVIYVRHIELDDYENKSIESEGSVDKLVDQYPFDDEETGYIGDADDENIQPNEGTEPVDESDDEVNEPVGENHTEFDSFLDDLLVNDGGLMDMRDSGGSDVQSVGDDSDLSDFLADSEYFDSEDDVSFYENIDIGVEWGGFREPTVNVPRKSERLNKGKQPVVEKPKKIEATHNNFPVFNPKLDMDDPHFELGLCFPDADTFRAAIKQHSRVHGRDLKYKKNDKDKVRAICKHKGCPWMIYASQIRGELTLQVKTIHSVHECTRKEKVTAATSNWLASKYQDKLRTDPNWPINSMMVVAQKECKLLFSTHQMYRAKKRANELNRGTHVEQYGLIWRYAEEIRRTNPSTTIKIKTKPAGEDLRFKRIYICWGALKRGLMEGCRRMIFLDGCHLKSTYGGILLCAVGIDANNGMYPFAYVVVEKEKKDSWTWFVDLLKTDLEIGESGGWTIMSDKQKGLIDAVDLLMPNCEHRFCVMHLYSNFKLSHRGLALKNILWQAARASRIVDFERIMRDLGTKDKVAFQWLAKRPAANWSRSFFSTNSKCDTLLNNMCESFNAILVRARGMPIIDMLEDIRLILMKRLHVRRDKMLKHNGDICPVIQKRLDFLKEKSMEFIAHWNGHNQFELEGCYGDRLKVNIDEKTCSCRRWQLSGIPCAHAISAMYYMSYTPEDFVENWYKKDTYLKVYSHLMDAIEGSGAWPRSQRQKLLPPDIEKMPGRPKLHKRKLQPGEVNGPKERQTQSCKTITKIGKLERQGLIMTCSLCHQQRHNARGCPLKNASGQQSNAKKRKGSETHGAIPVEAPMQESQSSRSCSGFEIPPPSQGTIGPSQDTVHTSFSGIKPPTRKKLQVTKKIAATIGGTKAVENKIVGKKMPVGKKKAMEKNK